MAMVVAVGFVVDDAIVMIENAYRGLEKGHSPLRSAIEGAQQIGFDGCRNQRFADCSIHSGCCSCGGIDGRRLFREFSVTLAVAIIFPWWSR